jgi:small subunit ribosomal protein S6
MPTLTPSTEDVRIYEVAVLLPYPMGQKEEQQTIKEVENILREAGAQELSKDVWGRRGLAYPIRGSIEGNFVVYHVEMDPRKLQEVDKALRIVSGVLRHMTVKPPKGYEIVRYSVAYEEWMKTRVTLAEKAKREQEVELQKRVAEKAKRQVKRAERVKAEATEEKQEVSKEEIGKKLDELISDDSLNI